MNHLNPTHEPSVHVHQLKQSLNIYQLYQYFNEEKAVFINKDKSYQWLGIGVYRQITESDIAPAQIESQFKSNFTSLNARLKPHVKIFGGFHFDGYGSQYFKDYDLSHFIIPKIQIEILKNETIITLIDGDAAQLHEIVEAISNFDLPVDALNVMLQNVQITSIEDIDLEAFKHNVQSATDLMKQSDLQKVVLSRKKRVTLNQIVPSDILYRALMNEEYSYFSMFQAGHSLFVTKTPEQLVKLNDQSFVTNAIAGTMDKNIKGSKSVLLNDEKNLIEHQLVTNSIVNDLKTITDIIEYSPNPQILENQFFYHLYTPIKGKLEKSSLLALAELLHPTPALGGYPKVLSNAFLKSIHEERGLYGAPLGMMDLNGNGEFIVSIRSMLIENNIAMLFGGCGIVEESKVDLEVHETEIKFNPMFKMLGGKV